MCLSNKVSIEMCLALVMWLTYFVINPRVKYLDIYLNLSCIEKNLHPPKNTFSLDVEHSNLDVIYNSCFKLLFCLSRRLGKKLIQIRDKFFLTEILVEKVLL